MNKKGRWLWLMSITLFLVLLIPLIVYSETELPGAVLFRDKGCIGCHSIGGQGGKVGPALDNVGDRYSAEWIYKWLRDPAAVKPGTKMPNLHLTDEERALLVFYLERQSSDKTQSKITVKIYDGVKTNPPDLNPESPENEYLALGVKESYIRKQRFTIQDQIQSFIPPLYEPAFTQSAFVLPPGALRTAVSFRYLSDINEDDFSGQRRFGARVANFDLKRTFLDFDAFLGLDRNFTLRVNVPFSTSRVDAELNPGFLDPVSVFPKGSVTEFGDISVFLKKKFVDQGNFLISIAGAVGIRLPTGSNKKRFNSRTTASIGGENQLLPLPAVDGGGEVIPGSADATFRRFSNDGRLPAPLQPGLGTIGGSFGLFATRILEGHSIFGRGAFHTGALYEVRPEDDGIDPGDVLRYFVTVVKPVYGDNVSFDLTYLLRYQQDDSYDGKIAVPVAGGGIAIVNRPPFSGGYTQFIGTSFIVTPNPLYRFTITGLWRIDEPDLGPSPPFVIRLGLQYTFASGLFQ